MTAENKFDYSTTGFADRDDWKKAAQIGFEAVAATGWGGDLEGVNEFMRRQPIAAARRLIDLCDDTSPEAVSLVLMGPMGRGQLFEVADMVKKLELIEDNFNTIAQTLAQDHGMTDIQARARMEATIEMMKETVAEFSVFSSRTTHLAAASVGMMQPADDKMVRDVKRIEITEAISAMEDQMLNRTRVDSMHDIRKNMLQNFGEMFAAYGGENSKLDAVFTDAFNRSKKVLADLDQQVADGKMVKPKQKGPGF